VDRISFTYITNQISKLDACEIVHQLISKYPISFKRLETISEVFPLLSDPNFYTDYVTVDLELMYENNVTDIFSLLNTLKTLINSTVHRDKNGKTKVRKTKILCIVGLETDPKLIREVIRMNTVDGFTVRYGNGITIEHLEESVENILKGDLSLPKIIQDKIKNNKTKKNSEDEIYLTPRQEQIFKLVSERGSSNKVIAKILNLSESTIKLHISAIFKKYGVKNRTQLAVFSKKNNLRSTKVVENKLYSYYT
jgi:DNA-binding NarL/FixJ family response regulator